MPIFEERRKDYQDLNKKLDYFEQDFYELKVEMKESLATIKSFMEHTVDYRRNLCAKLDGFNRLDDKIFDRIDKITQNCISNIPKYVEMENHIKEEKCAKSFFRDRKYQVLISSYVAVLGFTIWVVQGIVTDNKKILQKELYAMQGELNENRKIVPQRN